MKSQKTLGIVAAVTGVLAVGSMTHAAVMPPLNLVGDFAILGMEGGNFTINSATTINGNIGIGKNVTVGNAQKVGTFNGTTYVHSTSAVSFNSKSDGSLDPVLEGPGAVDTELEQANAQAISASATFTSMATTQNLGSGTLTTDLAVNSTTDINVLSLGSLNYNSNTLTLASRPGHDDFFVFNITGTFDFSQSTIALTNGTTADHVFFNFPDASAIDINKSTNIFRGTVLAPTGSVIYHNPADFDGNIWALNIDLHSAFNLTGVPPGAGVPEPASLGVLGLGAVALMARRRRA